MNSLARLFAVFTVVFSSFCFVHAQTDQELAEATVKALTLFKAGMLVDAVPYLETVVKGLPDSAEAHFMYGMALLTKSKQTKDTDEAKKLSVKSLEQLQKAKDLGIKSPELEALIATLSGKAGPSPEGPTYSLNKEADKLMIEGENYFAQSKYDDAIKKYEKAIALDPTIYQAAISAGDSYVGKSDWANAEKWYQRAITIDPNRETAYRYSATPLMKQEKYDLARERYIEAFITEPYSRMSVRGITQWAQITNAKLGHPKLDVPEVSFDESGKVVSKPAIDPANPATKPWLAYMSTREAWKNGKFAKALPSEKAYRHTLQEEVEALRAAVTASRDEKSPNEQLKVLSKIEDEGLLEAFVLMAIPDEDLAREHAAFLKDNRPKLRQYVANYVIHK